MSVEGNDWRQSSASMYARFSVSVRLVLFFYFFWVGWGGVSLSVVFVLFGGVKGGGAERGERGGGEEKNRCKRVKKKKKADLPCSALVGRTTPRGGDLEEEQGSRDDEDRPSLEAGGEAAVSVFDAGWRCHV